MHQADVGWLSVEDSIKLVIAMHETNGKSLLDPPISFGPHIHTPIGALQHMPIQRTDVSYLSQTQSFFDIASGAN